MKNKERELSKGNPQIKSLEKPYRAKLLSTLNSHLEIVQSLLVIFRVAQREVESSHCNQHIPSIKTPSLIQKASPQQINKAFKLHTGHSSSEASRDNLRRSRFGTQRTHNLRHCGKKTLQTKKNLKTEKTTNQI